MGLRYRKKIKSVVFDPKDRKEYLTGFHQRKLLRRQKAIKDFEAKIKEEKNRIKKLKRDNLQKLIKISTNDAVSKIKDVYEEKYMPSNNYPEQVVTVTTFSDFDLSNSNTLLGPNNIAISDQPILDKRCKKIGFDKVESNSLNSIDKMEKVLQKLKTAKNKKKGRKRKKTDTKKKKKNV